MVRRSPAVLAVEASAASWAAALAALVHGMKQCREQDGDLLLCRLAQPVRIIFELTRLDRAFAIFDSVPAAVGAFKSEAAAA